MLRTINGDMISPFTIFIYCTSALGQKLSRLMDERFYKMEFVYIGETIDEASGDLVLIFTVAYNETCLRYLFDHDFQCMEVCVLTEDEEAVMESEKFLNDNFSRLDNGQWHCQNNDIGGTFTVECRPYEAGGYGIKYYGKDRA